MNEAKQIPINEDAASDQQGLRTDVKRYRVPITAEIQTSLSCEVTVYAGSDIEAVEKARRKIETNTMDDDAEMEGFESGLGMPYDDFVRYFGTETIEIDETSVHVDETYEVEADEVLLDDIKQLEAGVLWNIEALTKHKAVLESLPRKQRR